tara:strand:- start:36 stop:296 length:261 start_codon:yes stop_codon:yes gene_type:complete
MLKDMQSQYGPNPNLPKTDTLAGEGKKNAGLETLGANNASKYSATVTKDPFAFEAKKNTGLEGVKDGSKYGMTGGKPTSYIDTVEY